MAEKKKMSLDDILAACRKPGTGEPAATPPAAKEAAPASEPAAAAPQEPAAEKPAAPKPAVKPSAMSVADMLAAARAGGKPAAPKAEAPAEEKPKPAAAKPKTEAKPAAAASTPVDTTSILAMARGKGDKQPGPMSKAEAAAKGKPEEGKKKIAVPPMPAKPAYAAAKAPSASGETRRGFFEGLTGILAGSFMAVGFSSLAVTQLLWVLGFARFMFPNVLIEPPTKFKVGFPDGLAPGQVDERFKAAFGVWIVKHEYEGQAQIYALKSVCTHLGCTPAWLEAEQKFKCPCHGSGFYKDGVNFEGPAPRPLERYAIRISDDGQLEVDKSRVFHEETGQWSEPSCFVNV